MQKSFFNTELLKNFSKHFSGTLLAAIVAFLLMPVFTRVFTPQQFGVFYLFSSIINTLAIIATGRYEHALMLPRSDKSAINIFAGAFAISFLFSIISFIVFIAFGQYISKLLNSDAIVYWLPFVALTVFFVAFNQLVAYWLLRKKAFLGSSYNKVVQSGSVSAWSYYFGKIQFSNGLILGDILGKASLFVFGFYQLLSNGFEIKDISKDAIKKELGEYKEFPKFNLIPSFLDTFSLNLPTLMISSFYNATVNSFINLPRQILGAPLSLISSSLSQVFFQNIVERKNKEESIYPVLAKILVPLILVGILVIVLTCLFSEVFFAFIFGEKWRIAGFYAKFLIFPMVIKFIVSPLSVVFPSLNAIKIGSFWQFLYFCSICILFLCGSFSIISFILLYAIIELIMYTYYLFLIIKTVKSFDNKMKV